MEGSSSSSSRRKRPKKRQGSAKEKRLGLLIFLFAFLVILLRWLFNMRGFPQLNANDTANIVFWHFLFSSEPIRLIPETPKPLLALVYGLLRDLKLLWFSEILKSSAIALFPWFFFRLFSKEFGDLSYSLLSSFLVFSIVFASVKPDMLVPSLIYALSLLFLASWYWLNGKGAYSAIFLTLSGLLRNDFWFFSGLFMLDGLFRWRKINRAWRMAIFLPLLAPLLWVLFDWRISGSLTYSSETVKYVSDLLGFAKADLGFYVTKGSLLIWAFLYKNPFVLIFGLIGFLYLSLQRGKAFQFLLPLFLFPFLEILALYFIEPPPLSARFYFPTVLLLYALAPFGLKALSRDSANPIFLLLAILLFGLSGLRVLSKYDRTYLPGVRMRDTSLYACARFLGERGPGNENVVITHQGLSLVSVASGDWGSINNAYSLMEVVKGAFDIEEARYVILSLVDSPSQQFFLKYRSQFEEIFRTPDGVGRVLLRKKKGEG